MEHDGWAGSHRRNLGLLLALVALTAGPLAQPASATATPPAAAATDIASTTAAQPVESPSVAALRTSSTLAATVIGTAVLVGLFWYLVVRSRRK